METHADEIKRYSTAGFYQLEDSGREVESLNPAWRFTLDKESSLINEAYKCDFDDSNWSVVSLPNGLEELPLEASGGVNYQGGAWYRKHFTLDSKYEGKRIVLYFEAIMGKSKIWVNGELVKEQFGGYLPIPIEIDSNLKVGQENIITVWCDNSNDPIYPPGKPQETLDFCYFGGIYRDCWLISTSKETYITDENMADKVAGGGVFVSYPKISEQEAIIEVKCDVFGTGTPYFVLRDSNNELISTNKSGTFKIKKPNLWTPETPYLYNLDVVILKKGKIVDGYTKRIGIRSLEFTHNEGFILNGKQYPRKLMGANRHQDFAIIGNALSNSLHYRDALKLKEAGMEIIRNAHYPQDPAFMDACDELGLFVIVNTPGWQFWNDAPIFAERVYNDVRNMVRRDRTRPCVIFWEPILNETWYPEEFAKKVQEIVETELPGARTAADLAAKGSQYYNIIFTHPGDFEKDTTKVYFTREFGDNVDDWSSHNSTSRVARQWGEAAQLVQAIHYADPEYPYTAYESISQTPAYHMGGTLWHSFDHQRGYHPDPFYGGIMDAFRRPKYSYYMFQAQSQQVEPMVYIAHEMTPFSSKDVIVFSNCESVRLKTFYGDTLRLTEKAGRKFTFENAFDYMTSKAINREGRQKDVALVAEGLNEDGEVVATTRREMARRAVKLNLIVDTMTISPVANGSDLVVVTAQMVDPSGNVKRLNDAIVKFEIEGEGTLLGNSEQQTNPAPILWGEASVLVQTTLKAGEVKVKATLIEQGINAPQGGEVTFSTKSPEVNQIYSQSEAKEMRKSEIVRNIKSHTSTLDKSKLEELLKEVEEQQEAFGEKQQ